MIKNKGSVLIVALVFLLLLTVAGVSAMRLVQVNTQAAGASLERTYAQQAAEAALIEAEEIVHQRLANFDAVLFFAEGEDTLPAADYQSIYGMSYADRSALCASVNTVCFFEGECRNGYCSVGYFDTRARQRVDATDTGIRPYHMFPLGLKPAEAVDPSTVPTSSVRRQLFTRDSSNALVTTTDLAAWQNQKLRDLTQQKPWQPNGWFGGDAWDNSMTIDVNVTTSSASGLVTTETYQTQALVEFLGFNLAEGADAATALQPENMPPSQYWMMTYRATAKVDPVAGENGATTAFDGARAMVQGVYTRQIPQSIDAIMSVNGEFARIDGTSVQIDYGANCLENEMLTGSDYCHFKADIPPLVSDGLTNTGWSPDFDNVGGCFKATCASGNWSVQDNPNKPAMDTDQYFARYFKGASKTAVYDAATADSAVFTPSQLLAGADMTGKKIVVIDGDVDLGSGTYTDASWNIDPDARIWVKGRIHTTGAGAAVTFPKVGLFYVSGATTGENNIEGSTVFQSVIAFENGLKAKNSIKVVPYNNIFEGDVAGALADRSRYSWRELEFTN